MIIKTKVRNFGNAGSRFAAWIILTAAVVAFLESPIAGFIFSIIPVLVLTTYDGIQINIKDRTIRRMTHVCGMTFGTWTKLLPIERISVVESLEEVFVASQYGNSINSSKKIFLIRLYPLGAKQTVVAGKYQKLEKAKQDAELMSKEFNVPFAINIKEN